MFPTPLPIPFLGEIQANPCLSWTPTTNQSRIEVHVHDIKRFPFAKKKNSDLYLNIVARKCTLGRLKAKAVGQGCACGKNVLKMTFSSVTACVPVTLFLSLENKAYFALQLMSFLCVTKQNVELMKIFLNTDLLLTISQIKIQQRTKEKAKWKS